MNLVKKSGLFLLTLIVLTLSSCNLFHIMIGSGNITTYPLSIDSFSEIKVNNACDVQVRYGAEYSVIVRVDDNLTDFLQVEKIGDQLLIQMRPHYSYSRNTAIVEITMPVLESISVEDASSADISGFSIPGNFSLNAEDASTVEGDLICERITINAEDASTVELSGNSETAIINLKDASKAKLSSFTAKIVTVHAEDASSVSITAINSIGGSIEDASELQYSGTATCSVTKDNSSSLAHN